MTKGALMNVKAASALKELNEEHALGLARDHIAQAYLGQWGGEAMMEKSRNRIHWITSQVRGPRILDVGTSEGIVPILLGREGFRVVGIDINAEAIEYANAMLAQEAEAVRERVQFRNVSLFQGETDLIFDTVIMGEVIEHVSNVENFVETALRHMAEDGRLIVTTPFGVLPHFDHKHTFYLSDIRDLLAPHGQIEHLSVTDGYIRAVLRNANGKARGEPGEGYGLVREESLLTLTEEATYESQVALWRQLDRLAQNVEKLRNARAEQAKVEKRHHAELSETLEATRAQLSEREAELNGALREIQARDAAARASRASLEASEAELTIVRTELKRIKTEIERIKSSSAYKTGCALKRIVKRLKAPGKLVKSAFGRPVLGRPEFAPFKPLKQSNDAASLSVVAIVDEFSEICFRDEWRLTLLSKRNWREQIAATQPAFLFVESAWRGNGNQWRGALTRFNEEAGGPLRELLVHCREIGLPTVFWSKEDPPNFDKFKDAAAAFDWVFTTDADCVPRYREHCGHDRVFTLPFAAQPRLHNPAGRQEDITREIAFAGSWFAQKYPARQRSLSQLLDAAISLDLKLFIFDRYSELPRKARARHKFPAKYAPYIHPKLPYDAMLSAYRMFPIFLNVNSVTKSPTMFSRRVFELLACGSNVVSSPSQGMEALLPGAVATASTEAEARAEIMALRADPTAARRRAHKASRMVLRDHTYRARAEHVVRTVVPAAATIHDQPLVSVVLTTNRPERLKDALENYRRQTYPRRELLLALNSGRFEQEAVELAVADIPRVRVFEIPEEKTLAACLNHVLAYADGTYWAKFDDDDFYGAEYISDALLPFDYTDAMVVGKGTYFARISGDPALYLRRGGNEHKYARLVCGGTLVADVEFTRKLGFNEKVERGCDTDFLKRTLDAGAKIYSADPYNFLQVRDFEGGRHTWRLDQKSYLKNCLKVSDVYDDSLVVI